MKKHVYSFVFTCFAALQTLTAQVDLNNGLLSYYPFSQNANDSMANPANGVVTGATLVADKNGNVLSAYNFANAGDKISVGTASKLSLSGLDSFTFSVWVKPTSILNTDQRILSFYGNNYGLEINVLGASRNASLARRVQILDFNGNTLQAEYEVVSNIELTAGNWYHILATFDVAAGSTKLYINGVLAGSTNHSMVLPSGDGFVIGNHITQDWRFDGVIDEVRVYDRVVNAGEIAALAELTTAVDELNPTTSPDIYPNPVKDIVRIKANVNANAKISIQNMMGQSVYTDFYSSDINVSSLPVGMYLLKIINEGGETLSVTKLLKE